VRLGRRGRFLIPLWVLLAALLAVPSVMLAPDVAHAQLFKRKTDEEGKPRERRGLFNMLFGRREREEAPAPEKRSVARPRAATGAAGAAAATRVEPAVEKLENARVVLVVGDFMASGLGEGLEEAFAQSPGVRVVTRSDGSSGFVRADHFDWPGRIGEIVAEVKPAAVIVMIGSNDRQQMTVEGVREKPRSEPWNTEYAARAKALADGVRQAGVPLFWMGMPSFKTASMSDDMIAFNDLYRGAAEQAGGEFIDIWDGFVDENGAFAAVGPDMNGQRVRLRGSDGINMTKAGKRKLAFYAERPLNRILGGAGAPALAPSALDGAPVFQPVNPAEIDRTPPIALADPQLDGGAQLLGAALGKTADPVGIPVEKLVREGIAPPSRAGRADDFTVGGTQPVAVAAPAVPSGPQPLAAAPETTGAVRN
jgi:hypothetical protein